MKMNKDYRIGKKEIDALMGRKVKTKDIIFTMALVFILGEAVTLLILKLIQ